MHLHWIQIYLLLSIPQGWVYISLRTFGLIKEIYYISLAILNGIFFKLNTKRNQTSMEIPYVLLVACILLQLLAEIGSDRSDKFRVFSDRRFQFSRPSLSHHGKRSSARLNLPSIVSPMSLLLITQGHSKNYSLSNSCDVTSSATSAPQAAPSSNPAKSPSHT